MLYIITFNKDGYDPFLDFIKAYAIVCVLIGHVLPLHDYWGYGLWAGMQVPLFILIQSFHGLKRKSNVNWRRILTRVFIPFFIVQAMIFLALLAIGEKPVNLCYSILRGGGEGPGSYYPWIYLQIAILLPFVRKWMAKQSVIQIALVFLLICEFFEVLLSLTDFPDLIYRILAIRYVFLIFLGWLWVNKGIVIDKLTITFSIISFLSLVYFEYFSINDEVIFYNTVWKYHRWPCYYYAAVGGAALLHRLYQTLQRYCFAEKLIKQLAKCSYEIFLVQMLVIALYPGDYVETTLEQIGLAKSVSMVLSLLCKITVVFILSITIGYLFNKYYNRALTTIKLNRQNIKEHEMKS